MNRLQLALLAATVSCSSFALAQTAQQQPAPGTDNPAPATSPTEGTAADRTQPGATPTTPQQTPGTTNPAPATSPAEGTAADTTPPPGSTAGGAGNTSDSSSTPGNTTTPGNTSTPDSSTTGTAMSSSSDTTRMAAANTSGSQSASQIIGATVHGTQGDTVGTVQDLMIGPQGSITAIVISPSGSSTSAQQATVPWDAIQSSGSDGKLVVDSSRVEQGKSQQ
jgi:sporulation protein YlmC with PRC-barrel domain